LSVKTHQQERITDLVAYDFPRILPFRHRCFRERPLRRAGQEDYMASRILQEETEHEAWFIELLARERDNKIIPSGHFRRGEPGEVPYSKNRGFYNP
jgi:hypothetical protein